METYLSLTLPDQSGWAGPDKDNAALLKMFSVRQPFALLMAAQEKIPAGFSQILQGIVSITMRYNVVSTLQAAEQERTYSRVAIGISNNSFASANEVLAELRSIYPNDQVFRANFSTKILDTGSSRNKQIVRYILAKIESQVSGTPYSLPPSDVSIEHILPENPAAHWPQFDDATASSEVYRLGNMTLLEEAINREIGNRPYVTKRPAFQNSNFTTTQNISSDYEDWNINSINRRQLAMARIASGIWRVNQLH